MAYIFVPLLAFTWMFGLAVVAHAGQYFLSIVESSATDMAQNVPFRGRPFREYIRDGIDWPDEPFADYLFKGFFLGYLVVLWGGPAVLLGRGVADHPVLRLAVAGGVFWLGFPIGVLSSLASGSRWNPFWPGLFVGFAKRPAQTLGFYLLSAPVLAVILVAFDLLLLRVDRVSVQWAIALSPVAVLGFFLYARLVGRFGLALSYSLPAVEADPRPAKKRPPRRPRAAYDEKHRWGIPTEAIPDDVPELISPYDGPVTGYALDLSGKLPVEESPPPVRQHFDDEDNSPLGVEPPADVSTERSAMAARLVTPPEHEVALYLTSRPTEPANPYGTATVSFLFDLKTLDPWIRLTAGLVGLALLQRALDALRP